MRGEFPVAKVQSYKIVEGRDEIIVLGADGEITARFPHSQRKLAETVAQLPLVLDLFYKILDGVDGYRSEIGDDGRYWESRVVEEAWRLIENAP